MDTSAPVMPPTPVPRTTPVSVASPISPPVIAPRSVPTASTEMKLIKPKAQLTCDVSSGELINLPRRRK